MRIAIDAMGGDNAPEAVIIGSIQARDEFNISLVLCGKEIEIKRILEKTHQTSIILKSLMQRI